MSALHQIDSLPQGISPLAWLENVLPQSQETHQAQCEKAREALAENQFDPACTFFVDDDGPAGLVVVRSEDNIGQLDLLAVHSRAQRRGLGADLLDKAVAACRAQQLHFLVASDVHCRNKAAMALFEKAGFSGQSQGGLRMRRPLDGQWPALSVPEGFDLRPLQPGEDLAWVQLKNACFLEDGGEVWTVDHFQREFVDSPVFDLNRMFVATAGDKLAGTTSAWEWDYGWGVVGLIHWVGVDPQYRDQGLGEALMVRALDELVVRGYADAWLATSRERQAAVRLYERLGFTVEREFFTYTLEL